MKMLLLAAAVFLLGGCCCGNQFPKRDIQDTDFAIIRPGTTLDFITNNYASVTQIDGVKVANPPLGQPIRINPGKNVVEVHYYTDSFPLVGYFGPLHFYKTYDVLELTALPGHDYVAFADDECGKKWIWVEDRGLYDPASYTKEYVGGTFTRFPFTVPGQVVAGERPDEGGCSGKAKENQQQD